MSNEPGFNSPRQTNEPRHSSSHSADVESAASASDGIEQYSIPDYLIEDESEEDLFTSETSASEVSASETLSKSPTPPTGFFAPRPALSRGFDANTYPAPTQPLSHTPNQPHPTRNQSSRENATADLTVPKPAQAAKRPRWFRLLSWRKPKPASAPPAYQNPYSQNPPPAANPQNPQWPYATEPGAAPSIDPQTGLPFGRAPVTIATRSRIWEKQPYRAIAYSAATLGTLTAAWLLGILAARIIPGNIARPPLQESLLRKSSRLASSLWHLPQLWQTPTAETRIEAIPLPETGPILAPVKLSPIERQPLIDELNAVETELLSLDRRIQTLEKRLGRPPYQDADIEDRLNALRSAVDPPVRSDSPIEPEYEPAPKDPQTALLEVAKLKITLPSDALFAPGDSSLKESELLNQILDQLVNYPQATVVVSSYSDDRAGAIATQEYTLTQAIALSDYLAQSLPEGYRWVTIGGGQSAPLEPNDSDTGRQRNRRIEILVDDR